MFVLIFYTRLLRTPSTLPPLTCFTSSPNTQLTSAIAASNSCLSSFVHTICAQKERVLRTRKNPLGPPFNRRDQSAAFADCLINGQVSACPLQSGCRDIQNSLNCGGTSSIARSGLKSSERPPEMYARRQSGALDWAMISADF